MGTFIDSYILTFCRGPLHFFFAVGNEIPGLDSNPGHVCALPSELRRILWATPHPISDTLPSKTPQPLSYATPIYMNAIKTEARMLFYSIKAVGNYSFLIYCNVCTVLYGRTVAQKKIWKKKYFVLYSVKMHVALKIAWFPSVLHSKGNTVGCCVDGNWGKMV